MRELCIINAFLTLLFFVFNLFLFLSLSSNDVGLKSTGVIVGE
jgi:hypothetical protein